MGRPEHELDWDLIDSLCFFDAEINFIAERLLIKYGKPVNTKTVYAMAKKISRRIESRFGLTFVQYRQTKTETKKTKLKQLMWKSAESGSVPMQIFLAKNILGYSDRVQQVVTDKAMFADKIEGFKFIEPNPEKKEENNSQEVTKSELHTLVASPSST
ncbi:MAG: hypothetical protein QW818_02520 [Candidatus Aenigmatarchaeota archaeon]